MKRIQVIHNGQLKNLPEREANILLLLKKASLPPAPVVVEAPKRTYTRRNIVAEPAAATSEALAAAYNATGGHLIETVIVDVTMLKDGEPMGAEVNAETLEVVKPKRAYKRRDMQAE
jgi:hypothetical protein